MNEEQTTQAIMPWDLPPHQQVGAVVVDHCPKCGKEFHGITAIRVKNAISMHNLRAHTPGGGKGYAWKRHRPKRPPKWTPERTAKFKRTMRLRAKLKAHNSTKANSVQPVQFCPRCGCNVEVVRKAIEFADRQT